MSAAPEIADESTIEAVAPTKTRFPNLARGQKPSAEVIEEVTATCKAELEAAGISTHTFGSLLSNGEVPSKCVGEVAGWTFQRAWYYWVAQGPGLPPEIAERLHATHGREVRVEGHCGCPSPLEWAKGFSVGMYHVDTVEGLQALAETLRSVNSTQPITEGRWQSIEQHDGSESPVDVWAGGKRWPDFKLIKGRWEREEGYPVTTRVLMVRPTHFLRLPTPPAEQVTP